MKTKKTLFVIITLLIAALAVFAILELTHTTNLLGNKKDSDADLINYGPPTDTEVKDSESRKNVAPNSDTSTSNDNPQSDQTGKKQVDVQITTWNQESATINVNGFATGVIESDGHCKLTLTSVSSGNTVASQDKDAVPNASNTSCGVISIPLSKLSSGEWNAVIVYDSSTSHGVSDPTTLEVK